MTGHDGSRFKKTALDDRQIKSFKKMYVDRNYSIHDICERFNISPTTCLHLAKEHNLSLRPARGA